MKHQNRFSSRCQWLLTMLLLATMPTALTGRVSAQDGFENNSTRKIRVQPDKLSARVGTAINWETDFDVAQKQSKETGKPIFWYVPSVNGTFMDRQPEIDRYMQAGPFSWPSIIRLINEQSVPLRAVARGELADTFGLKVYQFVEPGFIVVSPKGKAVLTANRLTTLHPHWLFNQIAHAVNVDASWESLAGETSEEATNAWQWFGQLSGPPADDDIQRMKESNDPVVHFLAGCALFRCGQQTTAKELWSESAKRFDDSPMGWKMACESQGIGPFVRGFEVFGGLPNELNRANQTSITSGCPSPVYSETELWERGTDYLLGMQDVTGGVFDSDYDFGGTDSLPNVHVAVTALVGLALLESYERADGDGRRERIADAIARAAEYVADDSHLNFDDRDEILWAQAYRVRFLAAVKGWKPSEPIAATGLQHAVEQLEKLQLNNGSWFHEYANAFVTGTALTALHHARLQGATVNSDKVNRGIERLESQRMDNGAYPYATRRPGSRQSGSDQDIAASGGRISVCELARRQWGEIDDSGLVQAVTQSLDHHDVMASALKYDDHTSNYAYGGFFFWYDMQAERSDQPD
ncbi:MAG: hypothetical protein R3C03_16890 [Pirellulaceae bacterium]